MPFLPRPTIWQTEIGNINNVSDPKHRFFDEFHIPIPYLYNRAYSLSREFLNISDLNIEYNITKKTNSPIIFNDSTYTITENHNHSLLVICSESQNELILTGSNSYNNYINNWGFIWFFYDMSILLLQGNSEIDNESLGYLFLLYISQKNNVELSSTELLQLLLAGFNYYGYYNQLSNDVAKKYLKLIDGIRNEFYRHRL